MPDISRIAIGWLSVIGSVFGLFAMVPMLMQGGRMSVAGELFLFASFVIYIYGVWSGVQVVRSLPGWQRQSMWFWASQVPAATSSLISFTISCGFGAWLYLRFSASDFGAGVAAYVGSGVRWSYQTPAPSFMLGVNAFAIVLVVLLYRASRAHVVAPSTEP